MWGARCPLEERVYRGAGRSHRRARGDGVLVWSGVESPSPVFVVARVRVSSFEGERERRRHFARSACVRNVVFVYEHTNMVVTTTTT